AKALREVDGLRLADIPRGARRATQRPPEPQDRTKVEDVRLDRPTEPRTLLHRHAFVEAQPYAIRDLPAHGVSPSRGLAVLSELAAQLEPLSHAEVPER